MNFFRFSLVLLFVLVNALWASTLSVRLTTERHRTEWNWVEYRLKLKNLSNKPLKNPVVRYFAENPRIQYCEAHPNDTGCAGMEYGAYDVDSTLRAVVDYFSVVNSVKPNTTTIRNIPSLRLSSRARFPRARHPRPICGS